MITTTPRFPLDLGGAIKMSSMINDCLISHRGHLYLDYYPPTQQYVFIVTIKAYGSDLNWTITDRLLSSELSVIDQAYKCVQAVCEKLNNDLFGC